MNIGIDIDGVITDESHSNDNIWHNSLCDFLGQKIKRNKDSYYLDIAYNLSQEEIDNFLEEKIEEIYTKVNSAEGAVRTINQMYNKGYTIYLITARDKQHINITKNWLDDKCVKYHYLIHEEDKAPLAYSKNIKLFIEDNGRNAQSISQKGIKVILINKYHNKNTSINNNICRVNNWQDIREILYQENIL